ncbi:shugoshin 2 isoform X2 [Castor canadensis]
MEYPVMEADSVTSGIKRRVRDRRISKTKLNVSLASKIKTKIINNSSVFKISLKHNNRALAQALSREKENSRRITTEKMLLQKEVEKLNFDNTFLRLKLNNLNKKLIEIESLMNSNLITAIEMSSLSEFHQSSFVLPASKKKRISKHSKLMHLPFARVPLTSNDDDDDDGDDKEETECDNNISSKTSPDVSSSISTRQPSSAQCNLQKLFLKEDNQYVNSLGDSEHIASTDSVLPKESHCHSDQSSRSSLVSEMRNAPSISHRREKSSLSNVTERKKHGSTGGLNNPITDTPCVTDLDQHWILNSEVSWNNEINDCTNEKNIKMQENRHCLSDLPSESASEPNAECLYQVQSNDDFQLQETVHDNADMDLTASEVSKIVAVSRGNKNKSNKKSNCEIGTFRKVKDPSSEQKRERTKRKCKSSSDADTEEKIENRPERRSIVLDGKSHSEDPNLIINTDQLTEMNIPKKITLQNGFDEDDRQNIHYNKKKKQIHVTNEQEETHSFSQSSDKFLQENKFDMDQNSLTYGKSKTSRQTFVIHKLVKDNLFPNQNDKDTISENLEVPHECQTSELSSKDTNFCETQKMLDLKKYVTDMQPAKQNKSKVNKLRQKVNRRTEIISEMNRLYEDNDKDMHSPEKSNFYPQTQENKETMSQNPEASKEFQIHTVFMRDNGDFYDYETQNVLDLQKQITTVSPVLQNESKISKKPRQKVNRKTEIISEANHFDNDKSLHCSEKGHSFFLQKDKEVISGNQKDPSEFPTPVLCTKDSGALYDYETQNILGVKKNAYDVQPAYQNDPKIDKQLRQKVHRKTEIISEISQIHENDDKGIRDLEKDPFVYLTQKDKETISGNLEIANEFHPADFLTQDSGNLDDHETQNILDLQKHITNMQLTQQNESKINKLRQKVNRRTEIISEMNQIYEDFDKDVHAQKCYTNDCDFKISKSKQKLECQGIISEYHVKNNSNKKESYDENPNPYKLIKKCCKKSLGKEKNILTRDKNKSILPLTNSSEASVSVESGLKHTNETDSDTRNQIELPKNQKQSTVTLNIKRGIPFVEVIEEGKCPVKKVNKVTSKSKKRKILIDPSPDTHEVIEIIPDIDHRKLIDSEQVDKENCLENEKIVKIKSDFYTKVLNPLSQTYSPNIQNSSFDSIHESPIPLSISSTKNLIEENFALGSSPILQVSDDIHERIKEVKFKVNQRTQKSGIGNKKLQDLTDTCFVSNNTANFENESENLSSKLPSRKRRCTPVSFKEPGLKGQMRR